LQPSDEKQIITKIDLIQASRQLQHLLLLLMTMMVMMKMNMYMYIYYE